jgi:hypothetical protein
MSKTLTFEIPDEIYKILEKQAEREGRKVESVALEWLNSVQPAPRPKMTEEERQASIERFRRHAGAVSLGYPTGADNESIDRDLAREYGSSHEDES